MKKTLFMGLVLALTINYSPSAFSEESSLSFKGESSYDSSMKTISNGRYLGGGFLSIFPGFGIGHAIQGRYMEKGWIFTVTELATIGGFILSVISLTTDLKDGVKDIVKTTEESKDFEFDDIDFGSVKIKGSLSLAFLLTYISVKAWEMTDAFMLPSHYKVVKKRPFQIKPLVSLNNANLDDFDLGLSLKYKF